MSAGPSSHTTQATDRGISEMLELDEWLLDDGTRSTSGTMDSESTSIAYSYFSVDSTNMTMSNLPGPGRLLGNLYSRLGRSLEYRIFRANAKRHGADPLEVGARIRSMDLWNRREEGSPAFKPHVLRLDELKSNDARALRRCCRAMLYYTSTGSYHTAVAALREIIDLSIKYFPVRDAFNAVRAADALRLMPLLVKQSGLSGSAEPRIVESLAEKAQLCLRDNVIYSACRDSLLLPSWSPELHGIELRLTIEPFLRHKRLRLITADLIVFFELEQKESDPGRIRDFVYSIPFWQEYGHRKYSIGIHDLERYQEDILTRCCRILLVYTNLPLTAINIASLKAIIGLSRRYRCIREAFIDLGVMENLRHIANRSAHGSLPDAHQRQELQELVAGALFSLQDNEVCELVKDSTLRKTWAPEVEGAVLRLELEGYLFHPKLKTIASELISFIKLSVSTFDGFEHYAKQVLDPHWNDYGPDDRKDISLARVCYVLVKYSTECQSLKIRVRACKHIENMIFNHPSSRALFNEHDLSRKLAGVDMTSRDSRAELELMHIERYLELSRRISLCLQDHEVFPKSIAYFKELDNTLLEIIFDYLRSPELFFIGAKVLSKTWLKVAFLSEELFSRVVMFLLNVFEEIAQYPEAELLVVAVLEKVLFERSGGPQFGSSYPAVCAQLVDALSSSESQALYPVAFATIQEYYTQVDIICSSPPTSRQDPEDNVF